MVTKPVLSDLDEDLTTAFSGRRRQSVAANARATADVREQAEIFFAKALAPRQP
tara:strand:- start:1429 stop:1590 length:162 start_codon:yes stop_codon:yes gene_type:complete